MSKKIKSVSKDVLDDMEKICQIGIDSIKNIIVSLRNNNSVNNIDSLRKSLLKFISEDDARLLSRAILRLYGTFEKSGLPEREFVDDLLMAIKRTSESCYEKIKEYREEIISFIELRQVKIIFDSNVVEFSAEKILNDIEILTSIRPIFSKENNEVLSSVISHSLEITYFSESRENSRISLLIDRDDLEKIKSFCERALKREKLIKSNQSKFNICDHRND